MARAAWWWRTRSPWSGSARRTNGGTRPLWVMPSGWRRKTARRRLACLRVITTMAVMSFGWTSGALGRAPDVSGVRQTRGPERSGAGGRRDVDVEEVERKPGLAPRALGQRAGAVVALAGEGRALVAARGVDDEVQGL